MKKDAFYFPHFSNARHDRKIKRVIKELGVEGYGLFFMILEVLREQTDLRYPVKDLDLLADEFGTSEAKLKTVVHKYDLFQFDEGGMFFSVKQIFYLQPYFEKSERARTAANKRWGDANAYANALPEQSVGNASKVKESKVKESKVNESRTLEWFIDQFDQIFLDQIKMTYPGKDIQQAAKEAYAHLAADATRLHNAEASDCKRLLNTWLSNQKVKSNGTSKTFSADKLASIIESRGYSKGATE